MREDFGVGGEGMGEEWESIFEEIKEEIAGMSPYDREKFDKKMAVGKAMGALLLDRALGLFMKSLILNAANIHFCRMLAKPYGVNEETPPDYEAMAAEAAELAYTHTKTLCKAVAEHQEKLYKDQIAKEKAGKEENQ